MSKLYLFAAVFLFWTALTASLMHVQLVASPVHRMRVPTYRAVHFRSAIIAGVQAAATTAAHR